MHILVPPHDIATFKEEDTPFGFSGSLNHSRVVFVPLTHKKKRKRDLLRSQYVQLNRFEAYEVHLSTLSLHSSARVCVADADVINLVLLVFLQGARTHVGEKSICGT